jgi:uncharacterized membrane protein SirB2
MSRTDLESGIKKSLFHPSAAARNTILILSGYLLGTTVAHICSPALERAALAAGVIGTLAYVVLALVARKKQLQQTQRALRRATVHIERRMDQHARLASARLMLKLHAAQAWSHEQYVPVVRSAGTVRY